MLTIIKSFTVYNLTTVYGHRKGNCLNMLPMNEYGDVENVRYALKMYAISSLPQELKTS